MKTYEVELKRTSYVVITVEAEGEDQAQDLAWQHVVEDGRYGNPDDASWETESIEEVSK
jgi:hypothetical protein